MFAMYPVESGRLCSSSHRRGFSVVELMIGIALAGILLTLAIPSFTRLINTNRLSGPSNDFIATMHVARMEAMRRGVNVIICNSSNGTSCATSTSWLGWLVFTDADNNGTPAAAEILRYETVKPPALLTTSTDISGGSDKIVFRTDGLIYRNVAGSQLMQANMQVCVPTNTPTPPQNARFVTIMRGGRMFIQTPATTAGVNATCSNTPPNPP